MKISYELSEKEEAAANAFIKECDQIVLAAQKINMSPEDFERRTQGGKYPYYGAIGGSQTWIITRTSLGTVIRIKCGEREKDITDYDLW